MKEYEIQYVRTKWMYYTATIEAEAKFLDTEFRGEVELEYDSYDYGDDEVLGVYEIEPLQQKPEPVLMPQSRPNRGISYVNPKYQ